MNCYPLYKILTRPVYQGIFVKKISGRENIPRTGPLIVASNHRSYLDALAVIMAVPRPMRFIVTNWVFNNWFLNIILKTSRQIRFDHKSKESKKHMYAEVAQTFADKGVLGIFPEGMLTPNDELTRAYPGVGRFALQNKVTVLPIGIKGSYNLWPAQKRLPHLKKNIEVYVGKPISVHEMPIVLNSPQPEEEATRQVMQAIGHLIGQKYKY